GGSERGRRFKGRQRLGEAAETEQDLTGVGPGHRLKRIELDGAKVEAQGGFRLAARGQDIGAHGERLGEIGLLAQRLVERGDRLFASSNAPEGAAGAVERKRIDGRCGSFSGPGNWHRRRMLAALAE